ncbi:nitroreductase [Caballeronia sp. BR00000012568055]|uniref:nitroreductase family protein n=1 Tax=Caballeronia sp. BR00000012568055 TaxID=2918761 RepID=UPI0023F65030|nr:nitroreductase [Caballeronia sp. BR00000012568055]
MSVNLQREDVSTVEAVIGTVLSRASALELSGPEPGDDVIRQLIAAADRAPDHGSLRPWRITVVRGEARQAFGKRLAESARRRTPEFSQDAFERECRKAMRAPLVLIVAAKITAGIKVPETEQLMAVAAAVQNMWIVAHAMGLGAMWKTGHVARDPLFKREMGLTPDDHIVAFLYVGYPVRTRAVSLRDTEPLVTTFADAIRQGTCETFDDAN